VCVPTRIRKTNHISTFKQTWGCLQYSTVHIPFDVVLFTYWILSCQNLHVVFCRLDWGLLNFSMKCNFCSSIYHPAVWARPIWVLALRGVGIHKVQIYSSGHRLWLVEIQTRKYKQIWTMFRSSFIFTN